MMALWRKRAIARAAHWGMSEAVGNAMMNVKCPLHIHKLRRPVHSEYHSVPLNHGKEGGFSVSGGNDITACHEDKAAICGETWEDSPPPSKEL